jgi:hypothetical protein
MIVRRLIACILSATTWACVGELLVGSGAGIEASFTAVQLIQGGATLDLLLPGGLAFCQGILDDCPTPAPDEQFEIRWEVDGDPGRLRIIIVHPVCNPNQKPPTDPAEVPDCPIVEFAVGRGCMLSGSAHVSTLPGGHPWSRYALVLRYDALSTPVGQSGPCPPQGSGGSVIIQFSLDLSQGTPSSDGPDAIVISSSGGP